MLLDTQRMHIISASGGSASAVAADRLFRAAKESGVPMNQVHLFFANTNWEDDDLYRFNKECFERWRAMDVVIYEHANKSTPLDVSEKKMIIPNNRIAPCSMELKIIPFREYIKGWKLPVTVYLGLDWREQHRMDAPRRNYEELGAAVDYPLMWKPYEYRPYTEVIREWDIEPPRLYKYGFSHNNCGGRCVRQGVGEWLRLLIFFPGRFDGMMQWEEKQRAKGGARANKSMASETVDGHKVPLTLAIIKARYETGYYDTKEMALFTDNKDDNFSCFCATA